MGMQLIETIEVGSGGAASIEFTGIPQDGVDLILVGSARNTTAAVTSAVILRYNGITTSTYSNVELSGNSGSASSFSQTLSYWNPFMNGATSTSNTFGSLEFRISNYAASAAKSASSDYVTENNSADAYVVIKALSESGTSPVTSLFIGNNLVEFSSFSLYKSTAD